MNKYFRWRAGRDDGIVPFKKRRIDFRSTQLLLERRKRLRQRVGLFLTAFVGLSSVLVAFE